MAKGGVVWGGVGVSETVNEVGPVREGGRKGGKNDGWVGKTERGWKEGEEVEKERSGWEGWKGGEKMERLVGRVGGKEK
jgi:hypothetical protein